MKHSFDSAVNGTQVVLCFHDSGTQTKIVPAVTVGDLNGSAHGLHQTEGMPAPSSSKPLRCVCLLLRET